MTGVVAIAERNVAAGAEDVFTLVSDLRSEPSWNPLVSRVEPDGPVPGPGARYRERLRPLGVLRTTTTHFERPTRVAYAARGPGFDLDLELRIEQLAATGSRVTLLGRWHGHGVVASAAPLVGALLPRELAGRLRGIARTLSSPEPSSSSRG